MAELLVFAVSCTAKRPFSTSQTRISMPTKSNPRFMLCYLSSETKDVELALRYWETDNRGGFPRNCESLRKYFGFSSNHKLVKSVNSCATAFRLDLPCSVCGSYPRPTSRKASRKIDPESVCPECKEKHEQSQIAQEEQVAVELLKAVSEHMTQVNKQTIDYLTIPYDACLLVRALHRVIGDDLLLGSSFTAQQSQSITASDHLRTLEVLREHGIIQPVAIQNSTKGFELHDGVLNSKTKEVDFRLTPHHSESRVDALSIVMQRHPADEKAICRLWYLHAVEECIAYLIHETSRRGLCHLSTGGDEKIRATIENALRDFPISYLWDAIWYEVKTAAADSGKQHLNREKATATIPGKLARFIENARNGTSQFRRWNRLNGQHESGLSQVFREQFCLDLDSTGRTAERHIQTAVNQGSKEALLTQYGQILRNMMKEAADKDLSAEVMLMFAEYQRMQLSLDESVGKVVESLSLDSLAIFQEKTD